jgi:hypothetical protein
MRKRGMPLKSIALKVGVTPQVVSRALDPKKQARHRMQNAKNKRKRRLDPDRAEALRAYERAESKGRYKSPKYRAKMASYARTGRWPS